MSGVSDIVISLDNDAKTEALRVSEYLRKQGINVRFMDLKYKDAADMGYQKFYEELNSTKEFGEEDLLLSKISSL
jgi:hypothetical protein